MCDKCDTITVDGEKLCLDTKFSACDPVEIAMSAQRTLADVDFDTMVGVGMSGALVIPDLAKAMGKFSLILRKPESEPNPWNKQRFGVGRLGRNWLFVDDFTSSGGTHRFAMNRIGELSGEYNFVSNYAGAYFYTWDEFQDSTMMPSREPISDLESLLDALLRNR